MVHAGKVLLKSVANRLSAHLELKTLLPQERFGFRPQHPTYDVIFVMRRLQGLARARKPRFTCVLLKAYDSVDRILIWTVLAQFGMPGKKIVVIRRFHGGMGGCLRMDDGKSSDRVKLEQGLQQKCVLAPLLFNKSLTIVLKTATRAPAKRHNIGDMVRITYVKKREGRGKMRRGLRKGKVAPGQDDQEKLAEQSQEMEGGEKKIYKALQQQLWAMLYADGADCPVIGRPLPAQFSPAEVEQNLCHS